MRPLDHLSSLKLKLGATIVLAIGVTLATVLVASRLGLPARWAAVAATVASLGAVQLLARGLTSPLRLMASAADAMARGERGVRVPEGPRDEVGHLARAFNAMAEEVERSDRARRDFVADAAHELRTPIAAMRARLENAVDGVEDADPVELAGHVARLERLTEQLLDLSRLEAGAVTMRPRRFPVAELLAGCGARVEAPAGLELRGDRDRLGQVLANLVDNAHRHAPGTDVVVRAGPRAGGGVRLEVEDGGPGLPEAERERVFDRFARADASRSVAGTGLGLAIARSIVEGHGGAIRAEAGRPRGCRVVVELPG